MVSIVYIDMYAQDAIPDCPLLRLFGFGMSASDAILIAYSTLEEVGSDVSSSLVPVVLEILAFGLCHA